MTITPRYNFLPGTEIRLLERPLAVTGIQENGYSMVGLDDGVATVVPFNRLVEYLKLPGAQINSEPAANGDRFRQRLGGHASVDTLKSKRQRDQGRFHLAMCQSVEIFAARRRVEDPDYRVTVRNLDKYAVREFIAAQTKLLLGESVYVNPPRELKAGSSTEVERSTTTFRFTTSWVQLSAAQKHLSRCSICGATGHRVFRPSLVN
jgi:putative transposase